MNSLSIGTLQDPSKLQGVRHSNKDIQVLFSNCPSTVQQVRPQESDEVTMQTYGGGGSIQNQYQMNVDNSYSKDYNWE